MISEHIGAHLIFVKLRTEIVEKLYEVSSHRRPPRPPARLPPQLTSALTAHAPASQPGPTALPFVECIDSIEAVLGEEIIPAISEESRPAILTQVLQCCVEALESRFRGWESRYNRGGAGIVRSMSSMRNQRDEMQVDQIGLIISSVPLHPHYTIWTTVRLHNRRDGV